MADGLQVARLIPVSGIANSNEAETRATSALLSVLTIVRDLSVALLAPLGASAARKATVEAFIETSFKLGGAVVRPDGLLQVRYGSSTWKALVEVKTGNHVLDADQLNNYVAVAREQGIDAVLTISNEIGVGHEHPCPGARQKANSRVQLAHYSWTEILAHSVRAKVHRGISDPEQAWILGELIRYLEHPPRERWTSTTWGPTGRRPATPPAPGPCGRARPSWASSSSGGTSSSGSRRSGWAPAPGPTPSPSPPGPTPTPGPGPPTWPTW